MLLLPSFLCRSRLSAGAEGPWSRHDLYAGAFRLPMETSPRPERVELHCDRDAASRDREGPRAGNSGFQLQSSRSNLRSVSADERFMRAAIKEAEKGIGHTSPNPAVGAVIVKG